MWISFCAFLSSTALRNRVLAIMVFVALFPSRRLHGQEASPGGMNHPTRPKLVVLIDINADQKKVFAVEQNLASEVIERLDKRGFSFSLITFGTAGSDEIKSKVGADEAQNAIQELAVEVAPRENDGAPHLYEALATGIAALRTDMSEREMLVISGGGDDLGGKRLKQIRSALRGEHIVLHVAVVSWHPLYGTKGLQVRGFYLHDLAHSTHGKYVELGRNQKKVQRAVQKLVARMLQQHVR